MLWMSYSNLISIYVIGKSMLWNSKLAVWCFLENSEFSIYYLVIYWVTSTCKRSSTVWPTWKWKNIIGMYKYICYMTRNPLPVDIFIFFHVKHIDN